MPAAVVDVTVDESALYVTFTRPAVRNALTWEMYDALAAACDRADQDTDLRALVLRGTRDVFAAGTDIAQFIGFTSAADGLAYEARVDAVVDRLERVRVPTVAQVEGVAAGAGCILALACDLRVCTPAARFGVPIARTLGNCLSAANHQRLVSLLGAARTVDVLLTARFVEIEEASRLGLVTRLADAGEIDGVTRALVQQLAQHAPRTMRVTKEAVRRLRRSAAGETPDADLLAACYGSEDFHEGVRAFLEGRPPRFSGR